MKTHPLALGAQQDTGFLDIEDRLVESLLGWREYS